MRLLTAFTVVMTAMTTSVMAQEKVTVLLDWFVNPDHAPLFVALEKGYFGDHGLDVEIIAPSNPNDPPKLVAAGKGDIADLAILTPIILVIFGSIKPVANNFLKIIVLNIFLICQNVLLLQTK